ncbi:histidine kinase [Xanthomonas campestris pv. campestris]|nr:histidine kinase [Xanthomonas campestris pv. campestris]
MTIDTVVSASASTPAHTDRRRHLYHERKQRPESLHSFPVTCMPNLPAHGRLSPATPLDLLWQAPVITALVLTGEMLAAVLALAPGIGGNRWVYFGLTSLLIQWISLLTLTTLYALRRQLGRLRPNAIANISLLILLAVTGLACALVWALLHDLLIFPLGNWKALWIQFIGIALTVGVLGLTAFQNHWRARQFAVRAKQAELDALQARIHPHFLFNTLNTGIALLHQHPEAAERLLIDLADLFRAALAGPSQVTLEQELSLAKRYLEIEALRFGSRLQVEWQLPIPLPLIQVPTLGIQTLIENAIRHGIEPSTEGGKVTICVRCLGGELQICIANDLPTTNRTISTGHRIGLNAVRSRLHQLSGGKGRIDTDIKDRRYIATIVLPLTQPPSLR